MGGVRSRWPRGLRPQEAPPHDPQLHPTLPPPQTPIPPSSPPHWRPNACPLDARRPPTPWIALHSASCCCLPVCPGPSVQPRAACQPCGLGRSRRGSNARIAHTRSRGACFRVKKGRAPAVARSMEPRPKMRERATETRPRRILQLLEGGEALTRDRSRSSARGLSGHDAWHDSIPTSKSSVEGVCAPRIVAVAVAPRVKGVVPAPQQQQDSGSIALASPRDEQGVCCCSC